MLHLLENPQRLSFQTMELCWFVFQQLPPHIYIHMNVLLEEQDQKGHISFQKHLQYMESITLGRLFQGHSRPHGVILTHSCH